MNYNTLRTAIAAAIKTPANPQISGAILQQQLIGIVNALDMGALYLGMASTNTVPSTEANGFYFATTEGTYTNFLNSGSTALTVSKGEIALFVKSGNAWAKEHILTVGSTVTPNPNGTPSEQLNKIGIDGTIYGIPSGGGGNDTDMMEFLNSLPANVDSNGYEIPTTSGVLNGLRKVKQMVNIQYTAKGTYATNSGTSAGTATTHTGMPYSSAKENYGYIAMGVAIRTFMTAVNNPYSVFYTEDTNGERGNPSGGVSDYGFTWHGTNCGNYFGTVCSSFVAYALGLKLPYNTYTMGHKFVEDGLFVKVKDQSAQGVHLMDILHYNTENHVALITSVKRNSYGVVTNITISESKSPNCGETTFTAAQFNQHLEEGKAGGYVTGGGGCVIYRFSKLWENTSYTPSPFVGVLGESPSGYTYNNDICLYVGDYAAIRHDYPIWLNYEKGDGTETWSASLKDDTTQIYSTVGQSGTTYLFVSAKSDGVCKIQYGTSKWNWVPVQPNKTYKITREAGHGINFAVLANSGSPDWNISGGASPINAVFATGYDDRVLFAANSESLEMEIQTPADARFIAITNSYSDIFQLITPTGVEYTGVELYKGDTQIGTTVPLDANASVHKINVTSDVNVAVNGEGKYKARLTDGSSNQSGYTYWEVINAAPTVTDLGNGKVRVEFGTTASTPICVNLCNTFAGSGTFYEITESEIQQGYCEIDPAEVYEQIVGTAGTPAYLRVLYEGEYGSVMSDFIDISKVYGED